MTRQIPTLTGRVSSDALGFTLMHEHIVFNYDEGHRAELIGHMQGILAAFAAAGGRTIVELTPHRRMDWVTEAVGGLNLNVILSTGYYTEHNLSREAVGRTVAQHEDHMRRELTEGIDKTGIRPGIIKVAGRNANLSTFEVRHMTAAAHISKALGTPVGTHACCGAKAQQAVLESGGMDLRKAFFSHVEARFGWEGRTVKEQARYLLSIAEKGSSLLFNNFDYEFDTPREDLTYLLRYLKEHGALDRMLMSADMLLSYDAETGRVYRPMEKLHPETAKRSMAYMISEVAGKYLPSIGFTDDEVRQVFLRNPAKFFGL